MIKDTTKEKRREAYILRNQGRIEFLAAVNKIIALINSGFDYRKIHAMFKQQGKFTMSYSTFCYQLNKYKKAGKLEIPVNYNSEVPKASVAAPAQQPTRKLQHRPSISKEEVI